MIIATIAACELNTTKLSDFRFVIDASELGFPAAHPLDWPEQIETTLGNGHPLKRFFYDPARECVVYKQVASPTRLIVLND